jgi:hypothetical protein
VCPEGALLALAYFFLCPHPCPTHSISYPNLETEDEFVPSEIFVLFLIVSNK